MSEHHLMVIGDDRVDAAEATEVLSPYDGRVLGTVPTGTTAHIDAAVAAAVAAISAGPPPTHERATIPSRGVRTEHFRRGSQAHRHGPRRGIPRYRHGSLLGRRGPHHDQ